MATFGNEDIYAGSDNNAGGVGGCFVATKATLTEIGDITNISAYTSGGGNIKETAALYDVATGTRKAVSSEIDVNNVPAWKDFPISFLNAPAEAYWLVIWGSAFYTWKYESTGDAQRGHHCGDDYAIYPATAAFTGVNHRLSIHADYTPSKKGSNLANTMTTMLNSKMLFSACNRFPKLNPRHF